MSKAIAIIGVGEVGGVFARGFLKAGYSVHPVNRSLSLEEAQKQYADVEAVVVGVGEKDLKSILQSIPEQWKDKLILLQNELLPKDWQECDIENPTVISVWFEKKQPKDYKVIIPSPVYGLKAGLVKEALDSIKVDCRVLNSEDELLEELVLKNLYILTTNISGLEVGGNVGELWNQHQDFARAVASDVLDIQQWLTKKELNRNSLIEGMVKAFDGDLEHKCMGRSAPARLERAITLAKEANLEVEKLQSIASVQSK